LGGFENRKKQKKVLQKEGGQAKRVILHGKTIQDKKKEFGGE